MFFGPVALDDALGAILAHSQRVAGWTLKKGRVLAEDDLAALRAAGHATVVVARLEPGDLGEDEAADRLAAALVGPGVEASAAFTGRANLSASERGLLHVNRDALHQLNQVDEAITLALLEPHTPVEPRAMIGTLKIIPYGIAETAVRAAEDLASAAPILSLRPYAGGRVTLIQTTLPGLKPAMLDKTEAVTGARLARLEYRLDRTLRVPHETTALAEAIARTRDRADLVLVVGASAISDRRDVIPKAIESQGGVVEHFGMPVDPGNLLLLARTQAAADSPPVLGLPGCARSPKLNGADWVLRRLAAGLRVTPEDVTAMGDGGLLKDIALRPLPRGEAARAPARRPLSAAIVLAAGRSRRMGDRDKLLELVDGRPMVAHAVAAARASRCDRVVVVHAGDDGGAVRGALDAVEAEAVSWAANPNPEAGLSGSLAAGLRALSEDVAVAIICLGDMPAVPAVVIDKLLAAIDPAEGRLIAVPVHAGKRGNPVAWSRRLFEDLLAVEGDRGGRTVLEANPDLMVEVPVDAPGVHLDIDTPEALDRYRAG